ncbi:MAG: hypothetical protein ABFQ65_00150 [Nanoarchaeota archaeon]
MRYKLLPEQKGDFNSLDISKEFRKLIAGDDSAKDDKLKNGFPYYTGIVLRNKNNQNDKRKVMLGFMTDFEYEPIINLDTYILGLMYAQLVGKETKKTHVPKGLEEEIENKLNYFYQTRLSESVSSLTTYIGSNKKVIKEQAGEAILEHIKSGGRFMGGKYENREPLKPTNERFKHYEKIFAGEI